MPEVGFQYSKPAKSAEMLEPVWVQAMPVICYQVWINKDVKFQFIFWYPYADNWGKIYDMDDNAPYFGALFTLRYFKEICYAICTELLNFEPFF